MILSAGPKDGDRVARIETSTNNGNNKIGVRVVIKVYEIQTKTETIADDDPIGNWEAQVEARHSREQEEKKRMLSQSQNSQ